MLEQVAVFARGTQVFQATVLGERMDAEAADTFFGSLRFRAVNAGAAAAGALRLTSAPAVAMVLAFAFAYFLSALLRAVTATLAPVFSAELGLRPADLGLLAGAYFLGFAALQLPLGRALDRFGAAARAAGAAGAWRWPAVPPLRWRQRCRR